MASSLGTGDKKSVNVELNIVPFIDLMSCLTAFLLVAAVWVSIAQLQTKPAGRARDSNRPVDCDDETSDCTKLSVLIEKDEVWIGVSRVNDFERIPRLADGNYDWPKVGELLRAHKASAFFANKADIEIAADSTKTQPVEYRHLVAAMDVAVQSGFSDVGVLDAASLSARPTM